MSESTAQPSWRSRIIILVLPTLLFLAVGIVQARPFIDNITPAHDAKQDWLTYRQNAVSILDGGWTIPRVAGPYRRPGGFGYNYFVAAIFAISGSNATHVYLVQSAMLGLSIGMMVLLFGTGMTTRARVAFGVLLILFALLDVQRHYSILLLSENLLIALLPFAFGLMLRLSRKPGPWIAFAAGAMWGLLVLVRPNVLLIPIGLLAIVLARARTGARDLLRIGLPFLVGVAIGISPIVIRDAAVTGRIDLAAVTWTGDWMLPAVDLSPPVTLAKVVSAVVESARFWGWRTLYAIGFCNLLPTRHYHIRWHWLAMWAGVAIFAFQVLRRRRIETSQAILVGFIVLYLGPLIAVAQITNYAIRMMLPVIPAALALAMWGWDTIIPAKLHR